MNPIKKLNIEQGDKAEARLFPHFKDIFDDSLVRSEDKFSLFDFYGDDVIIELKSRNICKDTYPTTMIGMNKINECLNAESDKRYYTDKGGIKECKRFYFIFEFNDGLYYWRFTKKRYAKFEQRVMGTDKRGYSERSLYLMIPVDKLKPLNIEDTDDANPL